MKHICLRAFKPGEKPHMGWNAELLAQLGEWILTYTPSGTTVHHYTKNLTYVMQHSCFGIFNTKEFYNLFIDLNADGSFKMLYINIATPAVLKNDEISWIDLELDVVRMPGKLAKIVDEDEFEKAKATGVLTADLACKAEQIANSLVKIVDKGDFPFLAINRDEVIRVLEQRFEIDLSDLTNKRSVPFVENPDDRCVPATIGMVLAYFMPERHFTMPELEKICGYQKGRGAWPVQFMLSLADMGFQTHWIEDFDHEQFVASPKKYLRSILDDEAYEWQVASSDLEQEAARMKQYMNSGLPLEKRPGTSDDIKHFLDDGWLVRLEVNARTLSGKPGYDGHSILVIGYTDNEVIIHNPDGDSGNRPAQHVTWALLDKAWKEFGGSYSLYAFKL